MFRKRKVGLFLGLFLGAVFLSLFFYVKSKYVIPVAMYHSVNLEVKGNDRLTVSTRTFERQMEFLSKHKYNVISVEKAAQLIESKQKIPPRAICITFDDGNEDNFIYAFPILVKYKIPATFFIIVTDIGKPGKLSWEQVRQMQASGLMTFGSHTLNHPFLDVIQSEDELREEINGSKQKMEAALNTKINTFSYPCGRFNDKVRKAVVDAGYKAAVVTNPGKKCADDDIYALKRLRISENAKNLFIFWVETSGYYNVMRENRHK